MHQTYHFSQRLKLFLSIFIPVLIYQLANYSASFVDTTMTGQYDTLHLAGVSMATSLWSPFFSFLTGIVSALVPIVGHHLGKGDEKRLPQIFINLSICRLAYPLFFFCWFSLELL